MKPYSVIRTDGLERRRRVEKIAGRILLALTLAGIAGMAGNFHYADDIEAEAEAKQARADRIEAMVAAHRSFSHPCMATVSQGMTSVSMSPERCVTVREGK